MKHISYPSTDRFESLVHNIKKSHKQFIGTDTDGNPMFEYLDTPLPTLTFNGTVKLHGTNASVVLKDNLMYAQSRNNVLTIYKDNAGFAFFVEKQKETLRGILDQLVTKHGIDTENNTVVLYGEWCGGNIQKNVAIAELPKMFVVFGLKVVPNNGETSFWIEDYTLDDLPESNIYFIENFWTCNITIDFNYTDLTLSHIAEIIDKVEQECPVAKKLGISGIGEGVVFTHYNGNERIVFKEKGTLHSKSSVKVKAPVDVERNRVVQEFVLSLCTEGRMEQMWQEVFGINNEKEYPSRKRMGDFIKLVRTDIIKEEMGKIREQDIEQKELNKTISNIARMWFNEKLKQL